MPPWCIERQEPLRRGSFECGTPPVMRWLPTPHFGTHPTRLAAMRAYVEEMDPDFRNAPDQLIRAQWRAWARSAGLRTARAPAWWAQRNIHLAPAQAGEQ